MPFLPHLLVKNMKLECFLRFPDLGDNVKHMGGVAPTHRCSSLVVRCYLLQHNSRAYIYSYGESLSLFGLPTSVMFY